MNVPYRQHRHLSLVKVNIRMKLNVSPQFITHVCLKFLYLFCTIVLHQMFIFQHELQIRHQIDQVNFSLLRRLLFADLLTHQLEQQLNRQVVRFFVEKTPYLVVRLQHNVAGNLHFLRDGVQHQVFTVDEGEVEHRAEMLNDFALPCSRSTLKRSNKVRSEVPPTSGGLSSGSWFTISASFKV